MARRPCGWRRTLPVVLKRAEPQQGMQTITPQEPAFAKTPRPAVFLDRDGTVIEDRGHLSSYSEVVFFSETFAALRRLQDRFLLFIVTNQSGIAEGVLSHDDVERVNAHVVQRLADEGIGIRETYYCPHSRSDGCECIKPKAYFLRQAAARHRVALSESFVVGDHPHDVEFAHAAGAQGVFVLTGHGRKHLGEVPDDAAIIAGGIREAADCILARSQQDPSPGEEAACPADAHEARETRCCPLRPNPSGDWPQVDPTAYVDLSARIIGKVRIGPRAFIGPGAVIRADEPGADGAVSGVEIGAESNVQDGVMVHALAGTEVRIGMRTSLAHGAIVHGPCTMAKDCFIGFRALLFDAELSEGVFVGHAASVSHIKLPAHLSVPAGSFIGTAEASSALPRTDARQREFMQKVVQTNRWLADAYRRQAGGTRRESREEKRWK